MNQLATTERVPSSSVNSIMNFGTFDEAMRWASLISKSDLCPKDCRGKPADVLIRIEFGKRLGLSPMQALCNIATINGKPSVYGDVLMSLCLSSPICEKIRETFDEQKMTATCTVKRRGEDPQSRTFSVQDAKLANLWGRPGPWTQYPKRMLQMRARAWALRDVFADLLGGIYFAEEAQDIAVETYQSNIVSFEDKKRETTETKLLNRLQPQKYESYFEHTNELSNSENTEQQDELDIFDKKQMQTETYNNLCQIICKHGVSGDRIDKWLQRAQAEKLENLTEEQALSIIKMLENKNS